MQYSTAHAPLHLASSALWHKIAHSLRDAKPYVFLLQQALGLGASSGGGHAAGASAALSAGIPVQSAAADFSTSWGAGKKRIAVAADNQDAANITSYAKSESVKQLIRKCCVAPNDMLSYQVHYC